MRKQWLIGFSGHVCISKRASVVSSVNRTPLNCILESVGRCNPVCSPRGMIAAPYGTFDAVEVICSNSAADSAVDGAFSFASQPQGGHSRKPPRCDAFARQAVAGVLRRVARQLERRCSRAWDALRERGQQVVLVSAIGNTWHLVAHCDAPLVTATRCFVFLATACFVCNCSIASMLGW